MSDLFKDTLDAKAQYMRCLQQLETVILTSVDKLPDNPEVTRIGKGMVIKSSALLAGESIWSVYYRDWKLQHEDIKIVIKDAFDGKMYNLDRLLDKGLITHNSRIEKVHPKVLELVTPILLDVQTLLKPDTCSCTP